MLSHTEILILGTAVALLFIVLVYWLTGWQRVIHCYALWFQRSYWTSYNIVEAVSWAVKAVIIVPGLIFSVNIWQLYFLALITSMALIWASNRKLLPTLVGFNSLWIWISSVVLVRSVLN